MATAGTLEYLISIDNSSVQSGLANAESKVKGFGDKLSAWTVAKGQLIGRLVERAGASTLNFVKGAVQESRGFDKSMSQVAATLGKTVDQMNKEVKTTTVMFGKEAKTFTGNLTEFARFMGQNTQYTAEQAADALNYMALAGYDTEKSMRMLPSVLNLASAGNMDLARASDMVTDAQSALGLSIEQTEGLVDKMAKTASKTNTSVEQLGDAMLTVGGTAKMMGSGSINATTELSMALGVLADNGIKGSEGGTALRNVLLSLTAPTDKAAKKLKELGIEVFDSEGNMKDLPFILQDINEATKDMTQEERTDFLSTVFNKRDLKAIEALLGTDMSRWEELYREIGNADGAAAEMAETQLDNLEGDLTKFQSALSEAKLSIADKLTPTLRKFTQKGTVWVQRLTNAFNEKGFSGALKEARRLTKEFIAETLGIGSDSSWIDIGKAAATKIKNGIKNAFKNAKIKIAEILGVEDAENATWSDIAKKTAERIKAKFKDYKVKIADLLGIEEAEDATWGDIAGKIVERIKGKINDAKIKIADLLGIEDAEDATWGTIAGNIVERIKAKFTATKIKIADMLGVEDAEDATWGDIAGKITQRIKAKIGEAKLKIADLLGIEDAEDATWSDIGSKITERIKAKIGAAKIKIADLLGVEEPEDATWSDIGGKITQRIKAKIGEAKLKIADLLGIEEAENATWGTIGGKIVARLKAGIGKIKLKAADLLGIEDAENATWKDIGGKIVSGLSSAFKDGKTFLLKMILGDGLDDSEYTFINAGKKIAGWFTEAMGEGGFLDTLLKGWTEKGTAIAEFAGEVISGLATWISKNSSQVAELVSSIVSAIATAAPKIADALVTVLNTPSFQSAITEMIASFAEMIGTVITEGPDALKGVVAAYAAKKGFDAYKWVKGLTGAKTAADAGSTAAGGGLLSKFFTSGWGKALGGIGTFLAVLLDTSNHGSNDIWDKLGNPTGEIPEITWTQKQDEEWNKRLAAGDRSVFFDANGNPTDFGKYMGVTWTQAEDAAHAVEDAMKEVKREWVDKFNKEGHPEFGWAANKDNKYKMLQDYWDKYRTSTATAEDWSKLEAEFGKSETWWNGFLNVAKQMYSADRSMEDLPDSFFGLTDDISAQIEAGINPDGYQIKLTVPEGTAADLASQVGTVDIPAHLVADGVDTGTGDEPGHAKGAWDIPYDNYYAKLHRNEMVLTASQARQYREGQMGGGTSEIVGALQSLRNDLSNLQLVVGRKTFGRAVVNYGGSRMSDYIGGSESRLAAGYGT